jgi:uncharacterized surface protein with fasciclin (FAS1) repeats
MPIEDTSIVDSCVTNPDLTTLTQAVVAAGLGDALSGLGLTLFAPEQRRLRCLPADVAEKLFSDAQFRPQLDLLLPRPCG